LLVVDLEDLVVVVPVDIEHPLELLVEIQLLNLLLPLA